MKKNLLCLLFIICAVTSLYGQNIRISGMVSDEKGEPMPSVNVALWHIDSTFVAGCVTDSRGMFALRQLEVGDSYLLQVSFMGCVPQTIRLDNVEKPMEVGTIVLVEDAVSLQGVTVTASNVMKKVDRQIILPSQRQVKASSSGYELLAHMQLPGLKVDGVQQKVSTVGGGAVQLRINDIQASVAQVQALRPEMVLRVEYIDNPGVRYGDTDAEAVVNYVVKRPQAGVMGGFSAINAVTTGFGNDNLYLRANYKLSEFGLDYYISYRDYDERYVDETQTFFFPDGGQRNRVFGKVPTAFNYVTHTIEASYNLTKQDKYVFNALFTEEIEDYPHNDMGEVIREAGKPDLYSMTLAENYSRIPSLDLYYRLFLPRNQHLTMNVVGTYLYSDYKRDYRESGEMGGEPSSQYAYATKGKRYSLIGEAGYRKDFSQVALSAGLKYTQAYTSNRYTGAVDEAVNMHNSTLYGYVQLQGKWAKLKYALGAGMSREAFDRTGEGYTFYTFRPMLTVAYPVFKGANLSYVFNTYPTLPSLSALSDIRQQKTDLEVNRGNPGLTPYRSYNNRLRLSWGNGIVNAQLQGSYLHQKNPIMQQVACVAQPDGSYLFEYSQDNQKRFSQLNGQCYVGVTVVPDLLSVSLYGGVNRFESRGREYAHDYTAWYAGGSVSLNYKGFTFYGEMGNRYRSLFGETLNYGEETGTVQCSYQWKDWNAGVGMLYPFSSTSRTGGYKLLNKLHQSKSWTYIDDNARMLYFTLSWKFSSGRKHQAGDKTMNNADRDTGIAM